MDNSNWRPTQGVSGGPVGDPSMESGDWRAQLQADSRLRTVNKIMETLKRHLPFSGHEGLQELKKKALRFEEKIYTAATSQSDYLRKISLKLLTMETRSQNPMPDPMQANSGLNPTDPASLDSTDQTRSANGVVDWQEEVYQKIKAMKDLYLHDLNDMHQKILGKLQHHDSLPQQPKNELLEKLKVFKNILERFMAFLQIPKQSILAKYKDKLGTYEKQIVNIINLNRRKPGAPQKQGQALPPQHMQSQQPHSQSHDNQMSSQMQTGNMQGSMGGMQQNNMGSMQQNSVSSLQGSANPQQNMMNSMQPSSNLDQVQNSSMNSLQQVSGGSLQQNAVSGGQAH